mmetsp:Transcript_6197/g.7848  ORF Transcript_6197/g.7848 Transcript_6197/m.7848 type:complete len:90 (+) Transcript_6197:177-446(+)
MSLHRIEISLSVYMVKVFMHEDLQKTLMRFDRDIVLLTSQVSSACRLLVVIDLVGSLFIWSKCSIETTLTLVEIGIGLECNMFLERWDD